VIGPAWSYDARPLDLCLGIPARALGVVADKAVDVESAHEGVDHMDRLIRFAGIALWLAFSTTAGALDLGLGKLDAWIASPSPAAGVAHPPLTSAHPKGTISGFIDYTPRGTQPGLTRPLLFSSDCSGCHGGNEAHTPYSGWAGSMMANATRDPLFWAALDVANADGAANGALGIGDYCLRCHTPEGWLGGRVRKTSDVDPGAGPIDADLVVDGADGCMLSGRPDTGDFLNDYAGVGCHFCHRVMPQGSKGEPGLLENADLWVDDSDCDGYGEPCRYGPYRYPTPLPGGGSFSGPPHAVQQSDFHSDSAMCGGCHDVTTPMLESGPFRTLILDDGSLAGQNTGIPFAVERTFSEWQSSDFSRVIFRDGVETGGAGIPGRRLAQGETCQTCHMPQAETSPGDPDEELKACTFGPPRNGNLPTHEFAGANTWIPGILKAEYPLLARDAAFDRTVAAANRMLIEESASIQAQATLAADAATLDVDVRVTNLSGHKLPTGYSEGRRMWIELVVRDANATIIASNATWYPATGDLALDAQSKVYEIKQGIWDAAVGECRTKDEDGDDAFHFVLNNCVAKDNRIPPLGFTGSDNPEMAAYGYSYPLEAAGSGRTVNYDDTSYQLAVPPGTALPLSVQATLKFQLASKDYIEFLRKQAIEGAFPTESDLCSGEPGRPFDVGPQNRSRGEYVYQLWSNPAFGRSPPVAMACTSVSVSAP
jgi:hypothetical protein